VIPLTDRRPAVIQQLQPGDLVFFRTRELPGGRIGHIGIYLGLDTAAHPRFISSRRSAGGPTMGDMGGTSRLDGDGYCAQGCARPAASDRAPTGPTPWFPHTRRFFVCRVGSLQDGGFQPVGGVDPADRQSDFR
jgi:hypothetical protein